MSIDGIEDIINHHGVKGMKWGVRKRPTRSGQKSGKSKQKRDTSGLKKGSDGAPKIPSTKKFKGSNKEARKLSDSELNARLKRLNMEKQYRDLVRKQNPPSALSRGSKKVNSILVNSGSQAVTKYLSKKIFPAIIEPVGKKLRLPGSG
jgi:hypothetical protein